MEISTGIHMVDTSLFFPEQRVLVMNDLHVGYEGELHRKGVLVPRFQLKEILAKTEKILHDTKPIKVIINGDLKHEFGGISNVEWREVLKFLDFLLEKVEEVLIIQGNHDPVIKPIADKRGVTVLSEYKVGDVLIVHGDELVETNARRIVIGHEHPAITIREGSKWEKYKCFLKGKWKRHEVIAVPSFNPLLEGSDVTKEKLLSPFLEDVGNFTVYAVSNGEVFEFGLVKKL